VYENKIVNVNEAKEEKMKKIFNYLEINNLCFYMPYIFLFA